MLFRERLSVPPVWWVLAFLLAVSLLAAIGFYLGPVWGISVGVAAMAVAVAVFRSAAITLSVDDQVVRVGRSVLELRYVGGCVSLDVDQTTRRGGVEADARAHLVLRPYVATAVQITLDDADDPVPYWLVSSRRPVAFADAVQQAGGQRVVE
ncbi:MAG TPA: DUF3093 domain-containing protein [Propionibacteriaceae bacterium]